MGILCNRSNISRVFIFFLFCYFFVWGRQYGDKSLIVLRAELRTVCGLFFCRKEENVSGGIRARGARAGGWRVNHYIKSVRLLMYGTILHN